MASKTLSLCFSTFCYRDINGGWRLTLTLSYDMDAPFDEGVY